MALWVNPNVEFFGLDDVMPSNLNDRVPRDQAKIPNVRNWAVRDYGNRIGIWRLMEVLSRYGIRASAARGQHMGRPSKLTDAQKAETAVSAMSASVPPRAGERTLWFPDRR